MIVDDTFRDLLNATFVPLIAKALDEPVPVPRALTTILEQNAPEESGTRNLDRDAASHFATAAVDFWLRGVHSFLVSTSLTEASPIWASVSGYYSSHYVVRGFAHLLGYFQLFRIQKLAQLTHQDGQYVCSFRDRKKARGSEHQIYWRLVKATRAFEGDDLFTDNKQESEESDVRHRNHANYSDHLFQYPNFFVAQEDVVKDRIDHISKIAVDTAPLPRIDKFPDLEYVQLIAYHRIVRFRRLLDDVLEGGNPFWERHRTPDFATEYMDFQLAEGAGLAQPTTQ